MIRPMDPPERDSAEGDDAMLAAGKYERDYIDAARSAVAARVPSDRWRASAGGPALAGQLAAFEPSYFNDLVLVLESYFVHRTRGLEGKDGNALNEVRLLSSSLLGNDGRLVADKQIKLRPETSV